MNNKAKFLAIGLVLGAGIGIVAAAIMGNMTLTMGIVFGGGFGLVLGLAAGWYLDRRAES